MSILHAVTYNILPYTYKISWIAFTTLGTLSHAVYIEYFKLGFLKVLEAVTTAQVVVTAVAVS